MQPTCRKRRCSAEVSPSVVRITDSMHANVDTDYPFSLCSNHLSEARQKFPDTDVPALMAWLDS